MPKTDKVISDAEIMSYSNVPVAIAAQYLGCSIETVRISLKQGRAPYGYSVQNEETEGWRFHISPGLLVNYQSGRLQSWDAKWLIEQISDEVEKLVELRYKNALKVLCSEMLGAKP